MSLSSGGDIDLTSARVKAGSLFLDAGDDLLLNTGTATVAGPWSRTITTLGRLATVDVAGDAGILTGGDFEQLGARLRVGGNLAVDVGGDWRIGTQQMRELTRGGGKGSSSLTEITLNQGSLIEVGGASWLRTGGDLRMRAAVDSITVDAQSSGAISRPA